MSRWDEHLDVDTDEHADTPSGVAIVWVVAIVGLELVLALVLLCWLR